jgi:hypothetical protein
MIRSCLVVGLIAALAGCEKQEPAPAKPAPSVSAPLASASGSAAPLVTQVWFVGRWKGTYDAQHYLIETKKGEGLKAWADDAGNEDAGKGALALDVKPDGEITGTATGALGEMTATGQVDEDTFRVTLRPAKPSETAYQGFFLAKREGDVLKGRLQASSGDSLKVRDAPVEIKSAR